MRTPGETFPRVTQRGIPAGYCFLDGDFASSVGFLLLAGRGCSNHRNRRHIADTQPADVNVGFGASSLNSCMSGASFELSSDLPESGHLP